MYCYCWDDREGAFNHVWWVGPEVGDDQVAAWGQCKNVNHDLPPPVGWYLGWHLDTTMQIIINGEEDKGKGGKGVHDKRGKSKEKNSGKGQKEMYKGKDGKSHGKERRPSQTSMMSRTRRTVKRNAEQEEYHKKKLATMDAEIEEINSTMWQDLD